MNEQRPPMRRACQMLFDRLLIHVIPSPDNKFMPIARFEKKQKPPTCCVRRGTLGRLAAHFNFLCHSVFPQWLNLATSRSSHLCSA
jgi:hypothetical protein